MLRRNVIIGVDSIIDKIIQGILIKQLIEDVKASDYIDCGIKLLQNGYETDEILILAGLSYKERTFDAAEWFEKSLDSLKFKVPTNDELFTEYVRSIANDIISDSIPAQDGLHLLTGLLWKCFDLNLDTEVDLSDFDTLEDSIMMLNNNDPDCTYFYSELRKDNIDEIIKDEAKLFLKSFLCNIPSEAFQTVYCNDCGVRAIPVRVFEKQNKLQRLFKRPQKYSKTICSNCSSTDLTYVSSIEGRNRFYAELEQKYK